MFSKKLIDKKLFVKTCKNGKNGKNSWLVEKKTLSKMALSIWVLYTG